MKEVHKKLLKAWAFRIFFFFVGFLIAEWFWGRL